MNLFSCSPDKTKVSSVPLLDSTTDTLIWLQKVQAMSSKTMNVKSRIDALNALGAYYSVAAKYDSAIFYYAQANLYAKEVNQLHEQVESLEKMARCYLELQQKDSALRIMNEALLVSKDANDESGTALALQELGIYYYEYEQDSALALKYFNEEIKYDTLIHDSSSLGDCYSNIATVYSQNNDYPRSIRSYLKAISIAEHLGNDTDLATYNLNLGIVFREQSSYDFALDHLLKAAPFFEQINRQTALPDEMYYAKQLGSCYNSIGNAYIELNEPEKAIEYHEKAFHLRDSIGNKKGSAGSLTNLGQAYILLGQYDTAISYLNRSLVIKNQIGDKQFSATSVDLIGEAYYNKQEFAEAEKRYNEALELKSRTEDPKSVSTTLNKLALLYHTTGNDDQALRNLRDARSMLVRIGAKKGLADNYKITADVFLKTGNVDSARLYGNLHIAMKDSMLNEQKQIALTEMEAKYDSEKKEQEIALLTERNRADAATVASQHMLIYSLIGGTVLLIILVGVLFIAVRSRRVALQQSKVIIEQKQTIIEQKQTMMGELHHRIKNNLQVLSSLLELQQSRIQDPVMVDMMQAIDQRLTAMLLIHQGLYGDQIGSQVNMQNYVDALVNNLCQSYGYSADKLNITQQISPIELEADKALSLGFICNEVISNWFKHVLKKKSDAYLNIQFTSQELRFADNGTGILPEKSIDTGGSFGLRLIKLFSRQLNATLQVHSDTNGTTIVLEIP
jgi:two-component sensor histidine kinase